jgi:hypothetical protein
MIKQVLIVVWLIGGVISNLINGYEPQVYGAFPAEVAAGQVMNIQITIEKGNIGQFGRFMQELPPGFTAYSDDEHFSFKDNKVKFVWVHMTTEKVFSIHYAVQVPAGYAGPLQLGGQFSYIFNNEKKIVTLNTASVDVKQASTPDSQISKQQVRTSSGNDVDTSTQVFCQRQQKAVADGIIVKLLVHKESLGSMAKIIDTVPDGYAIQGIETKQSIVNATGNIVKFMWVNLPLEPEFVVSYKLKPLAGQTQTRLSIQGTFSYSINSITKTKNIVDTEFEQTSNVLVDKSIHTTPPGVSSGNITTGSSGSDKAASQAENVLLASGSTDKEPKAGIESGQPTDMEKDVTNNQASVKKITNVPVDEVRTRSEIVFRIQIAAGHTMVDVKTYFKKFKIEDKVVVEQHQGWLKYMIAGFSNYRDARDYRMKVGSETGIHDAFVAAFNNGQRVTVQEALMISNQKWYN